MFMVYRYVCVRVQGLCRILEAAVADGSDMLSPHLDHLLNDLYDKVLIFFVCQWIEYSG